MMAASGDKGEGLTAAAGSLSVADALEKAVAHHRAGRLQQAEQLYRAILQVQPQHPDANHNLGVLAVAVGQPEAALPLFMIARRANPGVVQFWLSSADALLRCERPTHAWALLDEACTGGLDENGCERLIAWLRQEGAAEAAVGALLQEAFAHHRRGDLDAARMGYMRVLQAVPEHADALHLLGVIAHQRGDNPEADRLMRSAIAKNDAVALYHCNHGLVLAASGRLEEALNAYARALRLQPDYAEAHNNRATALKDLGRCDEALAACERALELMPDYVEPLYNKANVLLELGHMAEANQAYARTLELRPQFAEAWNNKSVALRYLGRLEEALKASDAALVVRPDHVDAHNNRGNALKELGRFTEALAAWDRVLELAPDHAEAHGNRSAALKELGRVQEALSACERALALNPNFAEAHNSRGVILKDLGRLRQALEACERAVALKPHYAEAHGNRGNILKLIGRYDDALQAYETALRLKPHYADAQSNRVMLLLYWEGASDDWLWKVTRESGAIFGSGVAQKNWQRVPGAGRRLRVGYVSGDYREHAVAFFVEQLFGQHDRSRVELTAYSNHPKEDAATERLKALSEHWTSLLGLSDEAAAKRIRSDQIDVLIDLSGHTAHHRLGVFARRAAPVQAHYLGLMGSTGLGEMDYWIGDDVLTPAWMAEQYTESLWRLPRCWVAYGGSAGAPETGWQPASDGSVWLGSFNTLLKLTPKTIALWARVLRALPEAKLLLKTTQLADVRMRERVLADFVGYDVSPERIELRDQQATPSWPAHMAYYDRLDIALDPVGPVSGGTTSCDALWMGVSVVTKLGDRMGSRMSASMLTALGREEWIAKDDDEYIAKVVDLARDVEGRREIRLTQREQMRQSPLCDAKGLASALEDAYEAMFERWWAQQGSQVVAS